MAVIDTETTGNALPEQMLPHWRRAVLKVGSNLLAADGGGLTPRYAEALADFIARCDSSSSFTRSSASLDGYDFPRQWLSDEASWLRGFGAPVR